MNAFKIMGSIRKRDISILLDSGSTNSFIGLALVEELRLPVMEAQPLMVTIANGKKMTIANDILSTL